MIQDRGSQPESGGKEGSMPKGRRAPMSWGDKARIHISTQASGSHTENYTSPRFQRDPLPETALKAPPEPLWLEMQIKPAIAMMCTSHIVQDEATGITYMDTVTTSMGQVALGDPHLAIQTPGTTIEDITDLP